MVLSLLIYILVSSASHRDEALMHCRNLYASLFIRSLSLAGTLLGSFLPWKDARHLELARWANEDNQSMKLLLQAAPARDLI